MKVDQFKVVETIEGISVKALNAVASEDKPCQLIEPLDHCRRKVGDEVGGEIQKTDPENFVC